MRRLPPRPPTDPRQQQPMINRTTSDDLLETPTTPRVEPPTTPRAAPGEAPRDVTAARTAATAAAGAARPGDAAGVDATSGARPTVGDDDADDDGGGGARRRHQRRAAARGIGGWWRRARRGWRRWERRVFGAPVACRAGAFESPCGALLPSGWGRTVEFELYEPSSPSSPSSPPSSRARWSAPRRALRRGVAESWGGAGGVATLGEDDAQAGSRDDVAHKD